MCQNKTECRPVTVYCVIYTYVGFVGSGVTLQLTDVLPSTTTNCVLPVAVKVVVDGSTCINFNTTYHQGIK
jgi:hypothetical protein